MPKTISKIAIAELSIMRKGYVGKNADAVAFAVKGEPVEAKPSFLERLATVFGAGKSDGPAVATEKGWYIPDDVDVPDKIDGDGDGADDYDAIASLLCATYYDIQAAWGIGGESARVACIVAAIDTFRANYADVCSGGEGDVAKGGKRHSAADQKKLDELGDHLDAAKKLHADLSPAKDDKAAKGAEAPIVAAPAAAAEVLVPPAVADPEVKGAEAPAAAPQLPLGIDVAALTESILKGVGEQIAGVKAHVDATIAEHATAVDAKLADVAKGAQVAEQSALAASAAAVATARQPSAPGAIPTFTGAEGAEAFKGAPMTGEAVNVEIPEGPEAGRGFLRSVFRASHA